MGDVIAWISALAGIVVAITGVALWLSERQNSKTLRRQQATLEQQLAEARAARAQTKPVDLRLLDLTPHGGGGGYVDFGVELANYGTQQYRARLAARVADQTVACSPETVHLLPNAPPQSIRVIVPRPKLGELVSQFNNETTLYGQKLCIEAGAGEHRVSIEWRERIYDAETERERYEIQQRVWRFARGEETEADMRAEHLAERIRRRDEDSGPELYDV